MALLSSFKSPFDAFYPESLRERLREFPVLAGVGESGLKRLLSEANWFGLPGGMLLTREGENDHALFLVVAGCLGVFAQDEHGRRKLVAHVPAGETVGEMSLISGEAHSAQLVALRDSELLRISGDSFANLVARHPRVTMNLMRIIVHRLQQSTYPSNERARPRTFAIIPIQDGLADTPIAQRIAAVLTEMGSSTAVLDAAAA